MPADLAKTKKELIAELEAIRTENAELKKIDAERTRVGKAHRENDPMFRAIFEQAAVGVAEIESRTGRFLRINKKYCEIVGTNQEEMLAKTFQDITHPDDLQQDLDNMDRLLTGEIISFALEKRYVHKNGNVVWVNLTVSPLWQPGEEPSTHVAVVEDITERKSAQENLQKTNKLLRTILDNLQAIVFLRNTQGRYVFINQCYESLYDLKNEEIIGNTPYDFLPAETAERLLREDQKIIASGEPLTHEEMVPAGEVPLHFLTTKVPLYYADKATPYAVCGIATDITKQKHMEEELRRSKGELAVRVLEATQQLRWSNTNLRREILRRKRVERNLRESEERFRGYFELGVVGMGISGPDHTWLEANEYLCRLLGYSREELLKKSWSEITHPDDLPMNLVFWEVMVAGKTPGYQMEKRFICKDGGTIIANVSVRCVRDEEGTLKYNQALVEDITERKQAEEELRLSEQRLRRLSSKLITMQENERRRIGKELHDSLGQLLTLTKISIEACVQGLENRVSSADLEPLNRLVPHIGETIVELRRIIMDLRPSVLDDMGILAALKWFCLENESVRSGVPMELFLGVEEQDVREELKIVLFRVAQEAVTNALKHAEPGLIGVGLNRRRGSIVLWVEDDGKGFDSDAAMQPGKATSGFGLASMRERAEVAGGEFLIRSGPKGTKVEAIFPL